MNDQLGGGFHRYSVDDNWFVPHFEKMLYDQAQLAISYLEAYPDHRRRSAMPMSARDIFDYVLRDMLDPEGGFYSAEDADSVIDPAKPDEKGEGAFYIWTQAEIESVLGRAGGEVFLLSHSALRPNGNVREDPHGEFTGKNILFQAHTTEETAEHFEKPVEEIAASIAASKAKLLAQRSKRVRPHLDDKVLTAWNGLMISAFAKGGAILAEPRYTARRPARRRFHPGRALRPEDRRSAAPLSRSGTPPFPASSTTTPSSRRACSICMKPISTCRYLQTAIRLTEKQIELFEDKSAGGFFSTAEGDASLVMRIKDDYDGAEPSGNSVAAMQPAAARPDDRPQGFPRSRRPPADAPSPRASRPRR